MRFLPKMTPNAPPPPPPTPPPPPPAVFSFLSLSPQTFLEVLIFTAETDCKLHFQINFNDVSPQLFWLNSPHLWQNTAARELGKRANKQQGQGSLLKSLKS